MIAKCANPVCRVGFDHHIGGKFFRFHLAEVKVPEIPGATQNTHHVIHHWLCPLCAKTFSLTHVESGKVVLRLVELEFSDPPPQHELSAAYLSAVSFCRAPSTRQSALAARHCRLIPACSFERPRRIVFA
jgi:hypothetical protein